MFRIAWPHDRSTVRIRGRKLPIYVTASAINDIACLDRDDLRLEFDSRGAEISRHPTLLRSNVFGVIYQKVTAGTKTVRLYSGASLLHTISFDCYLLERNDPKVRTRDSYGTVTIDFPQGAINDEFSPATDFAFGSCDPADSELFAWMVNNSDSLDFQWGQRVEIEGYNWGFEFDGLSPSASYKLHVQILSELGTGPYAAEVPDVRTAASFRKSE